MDRLFGYDGDDKLYGGADDDIIYGGSDNDLLEGGAGLDRLQGDSGADTFLLYGTDALDGNIDRIVDFSQADNDVVKIEDVLVGYDPLTDLISDFITLKETSTNTYIKVDADGSGAAHSAQYIARLEGVTGQWTDAQNMINQGDLIVI